jgi:tetratricopeptide (TPR) repeat protein
MDRWEKVLNTTNSSLLPEEALYEFAMAHYGFIGYCLSRDQKQRARPILDRVEVITEGLVKAHPEVGRYHALRGALYGFRIMYQPHKAMSIGPKALKKVNQALEMSPDCPQAWVENGNKDWFMPEIFGGSKIKALAGYEKAIQLLEQDPAKLKGNWYYLNIQMVLAAWYEERGRTFASRELYRKVIAFEPGFSWAKEKLGK